MPGPLKPLTPLFPKNEPIKFEQGGTGDCYLLTSLDCILKSNDENISNFKNMFEEIEGGVQVKIPRTDLFYQAKNLTPQHLEGRYEHAYDEGDNKDIFFIPNDYLCDIDSNKKFVKTNSLAVKILERLSTHYFSSEWDREDNKNSALVHSTLKNRFPKTSEFVGKLIGISGKDFKGIKNLIKFKSIAPQIPLYLSMKFGDPNARGQYEGNHAYQLEKITKNSQGKLEFIVVNPWDNQKTETFSQEEVGKRLNHFISYNSKPSHNTLIEILLEIEDDDVGKLVFNDPKLNQILIQLIEKGINLSPQTIINISHYYKEISYLPELLNLLSDEELSLLVTSSFDNTNKNKDEFIELVLSKYCRYNVISLICEKDDSIDFSFIFKAFKNLTTQEQESLKIETNKPEFFKLVVKKAISELQRLETPDETDPKRLAPLDENESEKVIFRSLASRQLTRFGSLKDLIEQGYISYELLTSIRSEKEILIDSIEFILNNDGYEFNSDYPIDDKMLEDIKNHFHPIVKGINPFEPIKNPFKSINESTFEIYSRIYRGFNKVNPKLALTLGLGLTANLDKDDEFMKDLIESEEINLIQWIFKILSFVMHNQPIPNDKKQQELFKDCVYYLDALADYDIGKDKDFTKFEQIYKDGQELFNDQLIKLFYKLCKEQNEKNQLKINEIIKFLQNLQISFAKVDSIAEIEKLKQVYFEKTQEYQNSDPQVLSVFETKQSEIQAKADARKKEISLIEDQFTTSAEKLLKSSGFISACNSLENFGDIKDKDAKSALNEFNNDLLIAKVKFVTFSPDKSLNQKIAEFRTQYETARNKIAKFDEPNIKKYVQCVSIACNNMSATSIKSNKKVRFFENTATTPANPFQEKQQHVNDLVV